jgi:hypothetical protein
MELKTSYEGMLCNVNEPSFRKLKKLLENTFSSVEFNYEDFQESKGNVYIKGEAAVFQEDVENMLAVFDLLADIFLSDGKGIMLERIWKACGDLEIRMYTFTPGEWSVETLHP